MILKNARRKVKDMNKKIRPENSFNFRTKNPNFEEIYNFNQIPKTQINKHKVVCCNNKLKRNIRGTKLKNCSMRDASGVNSKFPSTRNNNKTVLTSQNTFWSPRKERETVLMKKEIQNYRFPSKTHSSKNIDGLDKILFRGNRNNQAQAPTSLTRKIPDETQLNFNPQLKKSNESLYLPDLMQKKDPVMKNTLDSLCASKMEDSKGESSINCETTSVKLANLTIISPMINLPKEYKKQLDKDSQELFRIFHSISTCSKETSLIPPTVEPLVDISYTLVKNIRIKKSDFKNFIAKRYTTYIAERLINFFDFTKAWSYYDFVNIMEVLIFQSNEMLYKICFEAFDYNNDGYISEIDLYQTMRELPTEIFISVLMEDFLKIIRCIFDKKIKKATFEEPNHGYRKPLSKIHAINTTCTDTLLNWNQNEKDESSSNFLQFCSMKFSPIAKKPSDRTEYAFYPRSIKQSARKKPKQNEVSLKLNLNPLANRNSKNLNKNDLLFSYCEAKELNEKISPSEFNSISFNSLVPSFAIDLVKYLCGYSITKLSSSSSGEYLKEHRNEIEFEKIMKMISIKKDRKK
ncbi:unnamed protein product [Moneuplotes crassus]|uniref:EF-hand domain-containing protein n=1 Tax=Euplotes crassus TaxID=5936 RepID=A0AAD1U7Y1_EUPCR|nr:unnamed protein product [Moneuplotes crassus]